MRRTILFAACSVLALSACGREEAKPSSPAPADPSDASTNAPARQAYDTAIEALTSAYFDELPEVAT